MSAAAAANVQADPVCVDVTRDGPVKATVSHISDLLTMTLTAAAITRAIAGFKDIIQ
jgi:hypothetical protein